MMKANPQNVLKTAEVGHGIKLSYVDVGTGQPVVFVHGSCSNYEIYEQYLGPFSQGGFRAISYSRRFSTPNNNPGDIRECTIPNNAEDLAGLIDALNIKPVHLVGGSRGGEIALYFATKHQDMLRTLTLVEAGAVFALVDPPTRPRLLLFALRHPSAAMALRNVQRMTKPMLKALNSGDSTGAARILVDSVWGPGSFDKRPESAKKRVVDNIQELHIFDMPEIGLFSYRLSRDDIRKIIVPTLIMRGETTLQLFKLMNDSLAKLITNSEQAIIPGGGHGSPLENPHAFNATVLAFLEKHSKL